MKPGQAQRMQAAVAQAVRDPGLLAGMASLGTVPVANTPQPFIDMLKGGNIGKQIVRVRANTG